MLATQTLVQRKPKSMRISYDGSMGPGVTAKDLILATIGQMGVDGAVGHVVEFAGPAIEALSMEGRMTICNMTIEGGGRAGMIAPDDDDDRLGPRPRRGARRAPTGTRSSSAGAACGPTRARPSTARSRSTSTRSARWSAGARTPAWSSASPAASRSPQGDGDRRALEYMGLRGRDADRGDQARPRLHRLLHELADRRPARRRGDDPRPPRRRQRLRDGRARLRAGEGAGRGRGPGPRSSATPASTGAAPAARCAWA